MNYFLRLERLDRQYHFRENGWRVHFYFFLECRARALRWNPGSSSPFFVHFNPPSVSHTGFFFFVRLKQFIFRVFLPNIIFFFVHRTRRYKIRMAAYYIVPLTIFLSLLYDCFYGVLKSATTGFSSSSSPAETPWSMSPSSMFISHH